MTLLYTSQPLIVNPALAQAIGLNEAIVLQQLDYWLKKSKHVRDGKVWIYNTYEEWGEQFPFWSKMTIRRIFSKLRADGLVVTAHYTDDVWNRTLWYTIDYARVEIYESGLAQHVQNEHVDSVQNEHPISVQNELVSDGQSEHMLYTETTTENTTESTDILVAPTAQQAPSSSTKDILAAYEEALGYRPTAYGQEGKAAKELARRQYTPEDVVAAYHILKRQPFWASKHVSLSVVLREIQPLANYAKEGGDLNTIDRPRGKRSNEEIFSNFEREMREKGLWTSS